MDLIKWQLDPSKWFKKEVKKIKKTKDSKVNKRRNQSEPDLWKEIRSNLKPLGKAYNKFREKRRIAKQKEEQRRLKAKEEQRLSKPFLSSVCIILRTVSQMG